MSARRLGRGSIETTSSGSVKVYRWGQRDDSAEDPLRLDRRSRIPSASSQRDDSAEDPLRRAFSRSWGSTHNSQRDDSAEDPLRHRARCRESVNCWSARRLGRGSIETFMPHTFAADQRSVSARRLGRGSIETGLILVWFHVGTRQRDDSAEDPLRPVTDPRGSVGHECVSATTRPRIH